MESAPTCRSADRRGSHPLDPPTLVRLGSAMCFPTIDYVVTTIIVRGNFLVLRFARFDFSIGPVAPIAALRGADLTIRLLAVRSSGIKTCLCNLEGVLGEN
jgi:hypothetical protein